MAAQGLTGRAVSALARAMGRAARGLWLMALLGLGATGALAQNAATLMADQVYVDPAGRLVAQGSVEIWHRSTRMTASRVVYDQRGDVLQVEGPITLSDGPDTVLLADSASLHPALRSGILTSARMVLDQQLQIAAARLVRDENGVNQLDAVVASSCPVCAANPTPLWEIRAESVTHNPNTGRLLFRRAQFRMAGVPIFYAPRLAMAAPGIDRLRGLLRPEISMDSDLGLSVGLPFFLPFGESRDLTVTPTLSTTGMASLALRWRAARPNGGLEIGGQITRDNILPGELRGYAYARSLFELADGWRLTSDLLLVSDRTYLETYGISGEARISGHVTAERIRRDQAIRARLLAFHSLRALDDNATLPNTALQAGLIQRHALAGGEARVELGAQGMRRVSSLDGDAGRDVARAHLQLGWRRSGVLPGGVLTSVALQGRVDHVRIADDSAFPDPVTRSALQGMVEFRWPWAGVDRGGARHVVEPVIQLIGARQTGPVLPNDDHTMPELDAGNLFALTRYSGQDSPDDGSRLNAGLRWTRHDPSGWSAEALVGRIWREAPLAGFGPTHRQPLGQDRSDWLLAGRLALDGGTSLTLRLLLDDASTLSRAESNLAWSGAGTTISTRYLYAPASPVEDRTTALSEWSFDVARRLQSGWSTRLGWDYDVEQSLFATARTGIEFRTECLLFDLSLARHFVTATNPSASTRFDMRLELLGIGGRAPSVNGRTCRA